MKNPSKQSGVGLIEVLIAVIVLSLGFLASAQMQVAGMRNSQGAYFKSQASFMLRDMTDRMRANRTGAKDKLYDGFVTSASTTQPACIASGTQCTPQQLANADLHAWSKYLYAPAGAVNFKPLLAFHDSITPEGKISFNDADETYLIELSWGEQVLTGQVERQTLRARLSL